MEVKVVVEPQEVMLKSGYFGALLSGRWDCSKPVELKVETPEKMRTFAELLKALGKDDPIELTSAKHALELLEPASRLLCEKLNQNCLDYLGRKPWNGVSFKEIVSCLSSHGILPTDMLRQRLQLYLFTAFKVQFDKCAVTGCPLLTKQVISAGGYFPGEELKAFVSDVWTPHWKRASERYCDQYDYRGQAYVAGYEHRTGDWLILSRIARLAIELRALDDSHWSDLASNQYFYKRLRVIYARRPSLWELGRHRREVMELVDMMSRFVELMLLDNKGADASERRAFLELYVPVLDTLQRARDRAVCIWTSSRRPLKNAWECLVRMATTLPDTHSLVRSLRQSCGSDNVLVTEFWSRTEVLEIGPQILELEQAR